jgi:hypothetical protein
MGTLQAATASPVFGSSSWVSGPDVWYYFTATSEGVAIWGSSSVNDLRLELRSNNGTLLKTANAVTGSGNEGLNFGGLTVGLQYYVRVVNANTSQNGGLFTLCIRRLTGTSFNSSFTPSLINNGCQQLYCITATGATSYTVSLTASGQAGAPILTANSQTPQISSFVGPAGQKAQYNTTYNALISVNYAMTLGDGSTETISITKPAGLVVLGAHLDLDVGSVWVCPMLISMGGTIKAQTWMCDAVKYQWKFERMLNGQLYLVNGNPVVIEGFGVTGTRDYIVSAANGFGSGTEWRVQVRPIFANNVVGQYYTNYQCVKLKGTAAAAPTIESSEETKELDLVNGSGLQVFPNPGKNSEIHLRWTFEGQATVKMWDAAGRMVYQTLWNNESGRGELLIHPGELGMGMYWIEVRIGSEVVRQRWIRS